MQKFGGAWTLLKLDIVEKYLKAYTQALKNQNFKLCYIDAFAGSGEVEIKDLGEICGSPIRSLSYPFDSYIFIDSDETRILDLREHISNHPKKDRVQLVIGDCNQKLPEIMGYNWLENFWRSVIFLDPYAMHLKWSTLQAISNTRAFDVWYLFPLNATVRNMYMKSGRVPEANRKKVAEILGTQDWVKDIYVEDQQINLFGTWEFDRACINDIQTYIVKRLETVFPFVAHNAKVLRNKKNSPMFLLCFATSNHSKKAQQLSMKLANHIIMNTN